MQTQKPKSTRKNSKDGNAICNKCQYDSRDERLIWYQRYEDYVSASEDRYEKRIQSVRSSCRQQLRNIVAKLHKEYEVKVENLIEKCEKRLTTQKSKFKEKNAELEKLLRVIEKDITLYRSSEKTIDDLVKLSDSENEDAVGSNIHEKCASTCQELQSLLGEKENQILQIRQELQELQETNLILAEKQTEEADFNTQIFENKEKFQAKAKGLKSESIQTDVLNLNQEMICWSSDELREGKISNMSKASKMSKLKIENLEGVSILADSDEELETETNALKATLESKENTIRKLQEKICELEVELDKSDCINESLQQKVKKLEKGVRPEQPPRINRYSNRSNYNDMEHMKRLWEKKISILQESMRSLRNEMYLRQNLEKQAIMLHRASVSYSGRPETPEETFQARLLPSDGNTSDHHSSKSNTTLPIRPDINYELSAVLAANGWRKR